METMSMDEVKRINWANGRHWFDVSSMRFFKSRLSQVSYVKDGFAYFISSEQAPHDIRRYSVRKMDLETGNVSTEGAFCEMTREQANEKLKEVLGG